MSIQLESDGPALTAWDRRVVGAIRIADAARKGVRILRVAAALVFLAGAIGAGIVSFKVNNGLGDSTSRFTSLALGQFMLYLVAPLAYAGLLVALSFPALANEALIRKVVEAKLAFHGRDTELAADLSRQDREVNRLNKEVFRLAVTVGDNEDKREWAMMMTLVARAIERVGDNAVGVGEQVIFVETGLFREYPTDEDGDEPG